MKLLNPIRFNKKPPKAEPMRADCGFRLTCCELASAKVMFTCDSDGTYPTALNPRYASRTPPDRDGSNYVEARERSVVTEMTDFLGADPAQGGIKPETSPETGKLHSPRFERPRLYAPKNNKGGRTKTEGRDGWSPLGTPKTRHLIGKRHLSVRSPPCGAGVRVGYCCLKLTHENNEVRQ